LSLKLQYYTNTNQKHPFLKDESFKLLKILTHKKFDNFPLSVRSFEFWNFLHWILPRQIQTGIVDDDNDDFNDDDVDKILCNISFSYSSSYHHNLPFKLPHILSIPLETYTKF